MSRLNGGDTLGETDTVPFKSTLRPFVVRRGEPSVWLFIISLWGEGAAAAAAAALNAFQMCLYLFESGTLGLGYTPGRQS